MDEITLMQKFVQILSAVNQLNWSPQVWFAIGLLFLFTFVFCTRELCLWFFGYNRLKREIKTLQESLREMNVKMQDLKERVDLVEAGVEDFDVDDSREKQQFEINH